jgi:hypothetical protein
MKLAVVALAATLLCGACSTTSDEAFTNSVVQLTQAGCHLTVNIAAQAGAVNPGSGIQFQGSADCPGATSATPVPAAGITVKPAEQAAPSATFLKP